MMTKEQTKKNQVKGKKIVKRPVSPVHQGPVAQLEEPDLLALQRAVVNPTLAAPADILALQRTVGNRAVIRLLARRETAGLAQRQGGAEGVALVDETAGRINRARGGVQPLDAAVQIHMSATERSDFGGVKRLNRPVQRRTWGATRSNAVQKHAAPGEAERHPFEGKPQFVTVSGGKVGSIYRAAGRVRLQHQDGPAIEDGSGVRYRVSFLEELGNWANAYEAAHQEDISSEQARTTLNTHIFEDGHVPPEAGEHLVEVLTGPNPDWPFKGYDQPIHESRGTVDNCELTQPQLNIIYDTVLNHNGPNENANYAEHIQAAGLPERYFSVI